MRGADALIGTLEDAGVEIVFGLPGGASLPLYDALSHSRLRHVLMRHEAGPASRSRPAGRARPTWSPRSPTRTWTPCPRCS